MSVREAELTMIVRGFDQNITRDEVEKTLKKLKAGTTHPHVKAGPKSPARNAISV